MQALDSIYQPEKPKQKPGQKKSFYLSNKSVSIIEERARLERSASSALDKIIQESEGK